MGANYTSNTRNNNSRKKEENLVPPGMTTIFCQRCGRKLGQVFSTNGITTCDKCGYRSYTRIYGRVQVILPADYLQFEGYYEDADEYIHKAQERINGEQVMIKDDFYDEIQQDP